LQGLHAFVQLCKCLALELNFTPMPPCSITISIFFCEVLPTMIKKTMDQHVLPNLASTIVVFASFDLWMSHNNMDIFVLIINFLNHTWVPMHIIVGLFEVNKMTM
jgi:hypothetical protein